MGAVTLLATRTWAPMAELEGLRVRVLKSLLALATVFENETKPNQAHCFFFLTASSFYSNNQLSNCCLGVHVPTRSPQLHTDPLDNSPAGEKGMSQLENGGHGPGPGRSDAGYYAF